MERVVHFGAGNVGRGFLGQLYSESGYEVVFVDIDSRIIDALNRNRSYKLQIMGDETQELTIRNVRALHSRDADSVASEIGEALLLSTAVGNKFLQCVAPVVAKGIRVRMDSSVVRPLNIIICENLMDASKIFKSQVLENLPPKYHPYVEERVGFVETVIGRMVPLIPPEVSAQDPTLIRAEAYKELPVDEAAFVGPIPYVVGMIPKKNFKGYVERKLFIHNAGHAVASYTGYQKGYEFIWEAVDDPEIHKILRGALSESGRALIEKHGFTPQEMGDHIEDLIQRFKNRALGDTIFRVARDPIRKLGPRDRLIGAAKLAFEYGIVPKFLARAVGAALIYDHPEDEQAHQLQAKIRSDGVDRVLKDVCGVEPESPLGHLIKSEYERAKRRRLFEDL
ncbi:MAG: mannitol-1-phosphate 5-dehydrogenase [bacterium]